MHLKFAPDRDFLTTKEMAKEISASIRQLNHWKDNGYLKVRIGGIRGRRGHWLMWQQEHASIISIARKLISKGLTHRRAFRVANEIYWQRGWAVVVVETAVDARREDRAVKGIYSAPSEREALAHLKQLKLAAVVVEVE